MISPLPAGLCIIALVIIPFDQTIVDAASALRPRGDLRRELELLQQFGGPVSIALAAILIWRLDPDRLRRVLDWLAAAAIIWAAVFATKTLVGRPRPKFGDPMTLLGPRGTRIVHEGDPPRHAWQFWTRDVAELWSMPSSHTAFAFVAAVFLASLYPSLRLVVYPWAALVAVCRVLFGAHYASDVLVGAAIALSLAPSAIRGLWGVRTLDWFWATFVDRSARPAWPRFAEHVRSGERR